MTHICVTRLRPVKYVSTLCHGHVMHTNFCQLCGPHFAKLSRAMRAPWMDRFGNDKIYCYPLSKKRCGPPRCDPLRSPGWRGSSLQAGINVMEVVTAVLPRTPKTAICEQNTFGGFCRLMAFDLTDSPILSGQDILCTTAMEYNPSFSKRKTAVSVSFIIKIHQILSIDMCGCWKTQRFLIKFVNLINGVCEKSTTKCLTRRLRLR